MLALRPLELCRKPSQGLLNGAVIEVFSASFAEFLLRPLRLKALNRKDRKEIPQGTQRKPQRTRPILCMGQYPNMQARSKIKIKDTVPDNSYPA
jgi:hypothetical protein